MQRPKRGQPRELAQIPVGAGVVLVVRPPDAFEAARAIAESEADMAAIIAADPQNVPTKYAWDFPDDRVAALQESESLRLVMKGWMGAVIKALHCTQRVVGVFDDAEGKVPSTPDFDLFAALFESEAAETMFRMGLLRLDAAWDAEKNGSSAALNGDTAAAQNSAKDAGQTPSPTGGVPALAVSASTTERASAISAPSSSTPPAPPPAPPLGDSPNPAAPGASPASAT